MESQGNPPGISTQNSQSAAVERKGSVREIYFPNSDRNPHDPIYVASFPLIIYFWPTILMSLLAATIQGISGVENITLGWIFVCLAIFNFIVLVHDFDQKWFIILVLGIAVFWLLVWIINLYGFTIFKSLAGWILNFNPRFSTDAYLLYGSLLSVLFLWGIITPLFDYWRLESNEFVHFSQPVGRDMSIARAQCTVYKEIPDIFECLLSGGGGSLVIRRNDQVLATISHVPFLSRRMPAIEHMLSETRVVVDKS